MSATLLFSPMTIRGVTLKNRIVVPPMHQSYEVKELVQAWGQAARRAHEAGFEVLKLPGAHGYLVHEFLSERSSQRSDAYGGSEANRMRFLIVLTTEAVRAR